MKFGIRKTKTNIFWLFAAGLLIGLIFGLRQPVSAPSADTVATQATVTPAVQK